MAVVADLIGVKMVPAQAELLGGNIVTIAGATTAQATGTTIAAVNTFVLVTTDTGETAVTLSSAIPLGVPYYVFNTSATAALLFPPSGGAIDGGSGDASVAIAQNRGRVVIRVSATAWRTVYGS